MIPKTTLMPLDKRKKLRVKGKSAAKMSQSMIIPKMKVRGGKSDAIIYENFRSKKVKKDDLCSNCGIRKKGPGFRFLCRYCFRKAGDEPVYSINSDTITKDIFFPKIPR